VCPGKGHRLHEIQALDEFILGLAGKANHQVGGYRQVGDGGVGSGDQLGEVLCGYAPGHAAQGGVASALQRQMQVTAQSAVFPEGEEIDSQIPRLQRGQAQAGYVGFIEQAARQVKDAVPVPYVVPVRAQMHAGEHHLAIPYGFQVLHLGHDLVSYPTAGRPSRYGYDAVGTSVVAAVLNLDEGAGSRSRIQALVIRFLDDMRLVLYLPRAELLRHQREDVVLLLVTHHYVGAQGRDLFPLEFSVTAGDYHRCAWMGLLQMSHELA
jgi:hypothetical protein